MKNYGYKVEIKRRCIDSSPSTELYGAWSEEYRNSMVPYISPTTEYPDVVAPFKLEFGETAFVVWAEWSSGDSFGNATNSSTEIIGVVKDGKSAFELQQALMSSEENSYNVTTSDGQSFSSTFAGWSGDFESLSDIHITTVFATNH